MMAGETAGSNAMHIRRMPRNTRPLPCNALGAQHCGHPLGNAHDLSAHLNRNWVTKRGKREEAGAGARGVGVGEGVGAPLTGQCSAL